jgi:hypothetical protein
MEENHEFIQWLFPNHFQSRFNFNSLPLSKKEAEIFRTDVKLAKRLIRAYKLIYGFFGIKLVD